MALSTLNCGSAFKDEVTFLVSNWNYLAAQKIDVLQLHAHLIVNLASKYMVSGDSPDRNVRATYKPKPTSSWYGHCELKVFLPLNPLAYGSQPTIYLSCDEVVLRDIFRRCDPKLWERMGTFYKNRRMDPTQNYPDLEEDEPMPKQLLPKRGFGPVTTYCKKPTFRPYNPKRIPEEDFYAISMNEDHVFCHPYFPGIGRKYGEELYAPVTTDYTYFRKVKGSAFILPINCVLADQNPHLHVTSRPATCSLTEHNPGTFYSKMTDFVLCKESNSPPSEIGLIALPDALQAGLENEFYFGTRFSGLASAPYRRVNYDENLQKQQRENLRLHCKLQALEQEMRILNYRITQNFNGHLMENYRPHFVNDVNQGPHYQAPPQFYLPPPVPTVPQIPEIGQQEGDQDMDVAQYV